MKKILRTLLLSLTLLTVVIVAGCNGNVVATVNGEKITSQELDKQAEEAKASYEKQGMDFSGENASLLETLRKSILEQMINNKLMLQEAKKIGSLTAEQVQEEMGTFKQQFSSEDEYKNFMDQVKMSEEDIAYILNMQDELVKDLPPVTDDEVRKYYEENKDQMGQPEQLTVRHVLFFVDEGDKGYPVKHTDTEAKQLAQDVIDQLQQGKDFSQLASEKSEDSGTKAEGGLYAFSKGEAVPEFEAAAFALKDGEYTKSPVKTDYGYHVIIREKLTPAQTPSFEEVKSKLAEEMNEEAKQTKFSQFMQEAKNKADITNKLADQAEDKTKQ
ncbi:MAG: peptidylprolyl isomerase [Desulfotomaculaceae bacterium]|nr:peptidylprolyl isomerase [Desulfotomaculaceae bacterium]